MSKTEKKRPPVKKPVSKMLHDQTAVGAVQSIMFSSKSPDSRLHKIQKQQAKVSLGL
jgi:hypothetical protein